ncbi:MAG: DegT/DnrJ/EryC1/StrS family aminotransferase [Planctomycetota bacterium]|jgi:perosamine synthetase
MKIRLVKPYVGKKELEKLKDVINRAWLGRGPLCKEFEDKWSEFLGVKASTAVNSGTAALHLAVLTFRFPKGKKILVPAMTFCSTANAVIYNDLKPVFVDVEEETLSIDIEDMKRKYTEDCIAVIPVHFGGHPAKMDQIVAWAKEKSMKVISDCAHVAGGVYKGRKLGTWADIACFSFQEKKILATGDGGMISSDNPELIEQLRVIKEVGMTTDTYTRYHQEQQGKIKDNPTHWYYEVRQLGYKYNMCDVIAAIGLAQLEKAGYINNNRIETMSRYLDGIKDCKYVKPAFPYDISTPYYDFMVRLKSKEARDKFIIHMQRKDIATGVHTMPVPYLPYYRQFNADVPVAMKIWEEYVVLPFFVGITEQEIKYVLDAIVEFDEKQN